MRGWHLTGLKAGPWMTNDLRHCSDNTGADLAEADVRAARIAMLDDEWPPGRLPPTRSGFLRTIDDHEAGGHGEPRQRVA
jgi:hypothetical protein